MYFVSSSPAEIKQMLDETAVSSIDDFFRCIPEKIRNPELNLENGIDEIALFREAENTARLNKPSGICLLGAGAYRHYIPAAVDEIASRSEFYTAYTPYQPEISQGTLKTIFDYQSVITTLTGHDITNASLYDGATALCEAAAIAVESTGKNRLAVSLALNPRYLEVLSMFFDHKAEIIKIKTDEKKETVFSEINNADAAAVIVQTPNFFGAIENLSEIKKHIDSKTLFIACSNPMALAFIEPPSVFGADLTAGDAQPLGIPLSCGGPYIGYLAGKTEFMRKLPGRICGRTVDANGRTAYVLTLQAREQHIRREKATSNICSNQALMALRVAVYSAYMGSDLSGLAWYNHRQAVKLSEALTGCGLSLLNKCFFNEFTVSCKKAGKLISAFKNEGITPPYYLEKTGELVFCATELLTDQDIALVKKIARNF